jgi:superfamily II DNA or RNA helicase
MQFLTTTRLETNSRAGNWSGTGAGKTLSAILASRLLNLKLTIVTCPNSVVKNWEKNIRNTFADSIVIDKQNLPDKIDHTKNNYIVINYEQFQQPSSANYIKKLLSYGMISFIVIDEVHYSKQRELDNVSKRKEMIKNLIVEAGKKNKNLKVLGMSATPVINTLFEGRSMIELITGKEHKDIETKININNCMYLFQKLTTIGTRYLPNYEVGIK